MDFTKLLEHHIMDHPVALLFQVAGHKFYLTYHGLMLIIAGAIILAALWLARLHAASGRSLWANAVEAFIVYVRDEIVRPNLGQAGDKYLSYFLTLFSFIIICNLLGLVPYGATATGNIAVTAAMAGTTFIMINWVGIRHHGLIHFLGNLVPSGVPRAIVPFLFILELVGLVTKTFALCIRLFANMIAGHIVILTFLSFIFMVHRLWIAPISIAAAVLLSLLEVFIALLQAYVFTLLTALFVGSSFKPEH